MPRMSATPGAWLGMYVFRLLTKIPAVVLPAEDSAIAKVVEDLLLDLLFEDGSGD